MAVQAAYMVPTMFEGGGMRAAVFPLEPRDRRTWDALVAIDFPLPPSLQSTSETRREFGAVLSSGTDVVIHGRKDRSGAPADRFSGSASFRPLIVTEIDRSQPLFAFTQACVSKKDAKRGPWRVARGLETAGGDAAGVLDDAVFPGEDVRAMSCERYLDQVPVSRLRLGSYTFSAALRQHDPGSQSALDARAASFLLVPDQASGAEAVAAAETNSGCRPRRRASSRCRRPP